VARLGCCGPRASIRSTTTSRGGAGAAAAAAGPAVRPRPTRSWKGWVQRNGAPSASRPSPARKPRYLKRHATWCESRGDA